MINFMPGGTTLTPDSLAQLLVDKGVSAARLEAVGPGKRELLVPTADEVDEPQNRRVEIIVR